MAMFIAFLDLLGHWQCVRVILITKFMMAFPKEKCRAHGISLSISIIIEAIFCYNWNRPCTIATVLSRRRLRREKTS